MLGCWDADRVEPQAEGLRFRAPVDMRKGFDGLAALVRDELGCDPMDGSLYLFVSRNRIRAKVLVWDGTGLCLYAKRLEEGRFAPLWDREIDGQVCLSPSELSLYLEGCEEVGKRQISPPEIDHNLLITGDLMIFVRPATIGWATRPS